MDLENFSLLKSLEQEWTCFLSKSPIKEPFMTERGFTYDKQSLQRWFQQNDTEPQTNEKVDKTKIVPNVMLKKVMDKIYNDLPKIDDRLIEKNHIISNLNEDIESLRKDFQREQNLNETNEEIVRSTNQKSEKIKRIQKEQNSRKNELKQKINQQSIQIMKNRRLIQALQTRQEQLMQQNRVQKQKIQKLEQAIASQQQQESMAQGCNEYYHNLFRAYIDDLTNCLNRILESANKRIKNESKFRQYMLQTVEKMFERNAEGHKFYFQSELHEGVKAAIKADQQYLSQQRAPLESVKKELIQFKEFYSKILSAGMTREPSIYLYYTIEKPFAGPQIIHDGEQLKAIPYSIPPTKDQLQAEWNKVIKIDVETPVNDQMWKVFVQNVNTKFPWLHELRIRDCQVNSMTFDELKKMKSLRKLILENSHFQQATIDELKKFKSELFWVDVQNNQL